MKWVQLLAILHGMINGAFENQTEAPGEATLKFLQHNYTRKWLFCWVKFMMVIKKGFRVGPTLETLALLGSRPIG
ncbi:hypothetical protein Peur_046577 [Populus x canadensis]